MTHKKNTALALKLGQIEKNPILALSTNEKVVEKYARITNRYGNIVPAIVGADDGGTYRMLHGQAGLIACHGGGIKEIPVIVAATGGEAEQMKLALLLSTVHGDGAPLSEGAFIDELITRHGISRRELMVLLGKSKSWISKRQSLTARLSDDVKSMVKSGTICARTAEEIAKLPMGVQTAFAARVSMDAIPKTGAGRLVSLYTAGETSPELKKAIIDSPLSVLDACPHAPVAGRHKEKRGPAERICQNAGLLIRIAHGLKGLLATTDVASVLPAMPTLAGLRDALADLDTVLAMAGAAVSPGKLKGGGDGQ
jgi:ParB-like chromosome segregation protein Spo0J